MEAHPGNAKAQFFEAAGRATKTPREKGLQANRTTKLRGGKAGKAWKASTRRGAALAKITKTSICVREDAFYANIVDHGRCCKMRIWLNKTASIRTRQVFYFEYVLSPREL